MKFAQVVPIFLMVLVTAQADAGETTISLDSPSDFLFDPLTLEVRDGHARLVDTLYGTGADGDLIVTSGMCDLSTHVSSGRSSPDGFLTRPTSDITPGATTVFVEGTAGFASGDEILLVASKLEEVGGWESAVVSSVTFNSITLEAPTTGAYHTSGSQIVRVPHYYDVSVSATGTLTTRAWNGELGGVLAFRARSCLRVEGTVGVAGRGYRGGPAQCPGCPGYGASGEGTTGGMTYGFGNASNGGSGGGWEYCFAANGGGGGGHAAVGGLGAIFGTSCGGPNGDYFTPAPGGAQVGDPTLSYLYFGGGGGSGGHDGDNPDSGGTGGAGGGILVVTARTIQIDGAIETSGGGAPHDATGESGGGGGGAGGTMWLTAASMLSSGPDRICARGGAPLSPGYFASGGAGAIGRIRIDYADFNGVPYGTPEAIGQAAYAAIPDPGHSALPQSESVPESEICSRLAIRPALPFQWTRFSPIAMNMENITWRFSVDGGVSFVAWDGAAWVPAPNRSDGCTTDLAMAGFSRLPATTYGLQWCATLRSNGGVSADLDELIVSWSDQRYPVIIGITDIPDDQGGQVRVAWHPSVFDAPASQYTITGYSVWRKLEHSRMEATSGLLARESALYPPGEWDYVTTVPARGELAYSTVAATVCDSTILGGPCFSTFFVSAMTPDPMVFFDGDPDSGYSVDNIAPTIPQHVAFIRPSLLSWNESPDHDFHYFTVYRSVAPVLDARAEIIGYTTRPQMEGSFIPYTFYHVTATDAAGNESLPGTVMKPLACLVGPSYLDFGPVSVSRGESSIDSFLVRNASNVPLTGNVTKSCNHYEFLRGGGPFTLSPGDSTWVIIRFRPTAYWSQNCVIETGCDECADVRCTGMGEDPTPVALSVEAEWTDYAVQLVWNAIGEPTIANFEVRRSDREAGSSVILDGRLIRMLGSSFVLRDDSVEPGRTYVYQVIMEGGVRIAPAEVTIEIPMMAHALLQNLPNPFTVRTSIPFTLAGSGHVRLEIIDIQGRPVRTVMDEALRGGVHSREWDGLDDAGIEVPSGIYFYRLSVDGSTSLVRKLLHAR